MSTNINSTEQIVEINAGDQITNINLVSQSTTQVVSGEQVVTVDVNAGTIPAAWGSITGTLSNQTDLQNALNAKQNNITLTTTGTTGVATLVGATLNIPNYVTSTKQTEWDSAYNDKITSAEVSGTTTKTLTLNQQDGGTITASWSDFDTAPVTSVFGRTGNVVATEGDYNIGQMGDVTITSASNGQVLKYNGTAWVNAADASGLTSVGLAMPSAFTVSGSPLTSNGTITVTGAGTTSQYVRGDGSLAAFPSVSNEAKTLIREVYNSTGATLTKGTVVYINGGQGNLPTVTKALAVGDVTSAQTFGIVQSDITNMNNGFVVVAGGIDNIDTQAFTEGTAIYLSPTTAGAWTSTKPYAPEHIVYLGVIVRSHPTQGVIEVKIQNGYELDELHNVSARFPSNKDGIFYNSTTSVWENKSIAGVLGYTPVPETRIITINGTAQNLSADRTYNVGTVTNVAASGGTGISIGGSPVTGSGTITITNTAPDQVVSLTGAGTTTTSGTYPNFTVTSNDQYVGTVTSVNATVPTGFEVSGVPITSSGTVEIKFASGYSLPTNAKQTQWDDAYAKRIDSLTVTGNSGSSTLTSNVLNVPTYTLTGLGGEPAITAGTTLQYFRGDKTFQTLDTSVVPENGPVYFTEPRVRATVLSGMNITGGAITASDNILNAFGKVQNQINGLIGGSIFQSTWNASTNVPALASGVGTKGYYYIVSTAGTTNLDGITDWQIGDWAIFDGTVWRKVDNTDAVVSVNGYTGIVSLVLDDLADVSAASPTSNQLLRFNGTSSKWENWTPNYLTTITLTGDVTGTGTSSIATTIGAGKVTNAMLAGSIDYAKMDSATVPTWNQDTTGNAATATKLATARNFTINGTAKSFDGSANVSWTAAEIGLTSYLPLTGGTLSGELASTYKNSLGALRLGSGDDTTQSLGYVQIRLGYNGNSADYPHFITTTHNSVAPSGNSIKFYTSDKTLAGVYPTNAVLGLTIENGNIISNAIVSKIGASNTVGSGSNFGWNNAAAGASSRQLALQMNAANGLSLFYYNGTAWANTTLAFNSDGSISTPNITSTSFTDGVVTWSSAQFNRVGGFVEMQYNGDGGVKFFGNTAYPITFASTTGNAEFSSVLRALRFSSGGAVYPNVAYAVRGTISGNTDSWGVYQNVVFAPSGNDALVVGYHAGGSSSVNTGTFTGLSYRGFYQQDLAANTGSGTLATAYGIYVESLSQGTNNYSAYFAQNVGIATATPTQPLDVNGFGRFYKTQVDLILESITDTQYSRLIFKDASDTSGVQYINSAFATSARRKRIEIFASGFSVVTGGTFTSPELLVDSSGNTTIKGSITGSLAALGTAATVFVTSDSGTLKTRTAAQVLSDIGGQAAGSYVEIGGTQTITGFKTFSATNTGGTGDYTNVTSAALKISVGTSYWRIPHISTDGTTSGVYNYETGKNVYWGEPNDTGIYYFRGRTMNIQALAGTSANFSSTVTATTFTDGIVTWSSAQINRSSGFVELQYGGAGGVKIFGNTAYPITFASGTGNTTITGLLSGTSATFSDTITIQKNQNGLTKLLISNTTAGSGSYLETTYQSDTSAGIGAFGKYSSTTTTYKITTASSTFIYNGTAGDIAILNDFASGAIKLAAGGSSSAHLTIASTGAATFSSTLKTDGNVGIRVNPSGASDQYLTTGDAGIAYSNTYFGTGKVRIGGGSDHGANTVLSIAPGVLDMDAPGVVGGRFKINSSGFVGISNNAPQGYLDVYGAGGSSGTTSSVYIRNGNTSAYYGNNQIVLAYAGTANYAHAIKTRHNSNVGGGNAIDFYVWKVGDAAGTIGGKHAATICESGVGIFTSTPNTSYALDVVGSVQATSYFESSDMRFKTLLENKLDYNLIFNIQAKYYIKNGKEELGYFAQELQGVFDAAVSKRDNGYLDLSYRQIHTAKIAALEKEINELKKHIKQK